MTVSRLETVVVSRKTPADGRLLISEPLAQRLAATDGQIAVERDGEVSTARLYGMTCACGGDAGGAEPHVHHFVESPLLTALTPGIEVVLRLDETGLVLKVEDA